MRHTMIRGLALPLAVAGALTLSACSGADPDGHDMSSHQNGPSATGTPAGAATGTATGTATAAAGEHNEADVAFATGMIPHHGQALTMADMALANATDAGVKDLAEQIKKAQDPEIQQMSGWLRGWGEPVPAAQGMDHGPGQHGDGMMSMEEMEALGKARGAEFDTMWLDMMIRHHEGAVSSAKSELSSGANQEAKTLAQAIIDGQSREIATMRTLLDALGS